MASPVQKIYCKHVAFTKAIGRVLSNGNTYRKNGELFHKENSQESVSASKVLKAVIVGSPNSGKSTLSNRLLGRKLFAVSPKVHTTRRRSPGVLIKDDTQIILLDTPGIVHYRYGHKLKMSKELLTDAGRALMEADLGILLVDASNKRCLRQLPSEVLHTIREYQNIPFALALNKVDLVRHKYVLLEIADNLTREVQKFLNIETREVDPGCPFFHEVFMISALTGDGVDAVKDYLFSSAKPGRWEDISPLQSSLLTVVEDIVREKLFLYLQKEIPYVIQQSNVLWEESDEGNLTIMQYLTCASVGQKSIVIGPGGSTIQRITEEARDDIEQIIGKKVNLTLHIRTKKY